jgi:hypothetical protein
MTSLYSGINFNITSDVVQDCAILFIIAVSNVHMFVAMPHWLEK